VDSKGEVRIADVRPGPLVLRALAPGYENTRHIVVIRSGEHREVVFTLAAAKILNVTVRDTSGLAVEQAEVTVTHSGGGGGWGTTYGHETFGWRQSTDKEGRTSFPYIPPRIERVSLFAVGPKLAPTWAAVPMTEPIKDFEVVLQAGAALSVEVLDHAGKSMECGLELGGDSGGRSSFQGRSRKVAGSRHVFTGVNAGKTIHLLVYVHHSLAHQERDLVLGVGETRELTVRLQPGVPLTVRAGDVGGRPVEGMLRVTGVRPARQEYVEEIGPSGLIRLIVDRGQYEVTFSPYQGLRPGPRTVSIEAETTINIEVPGATELRGTVRDSDGSPIANSLLDWIEGRETVKTRTDASGRFSFPRVGSATGSLRLMGLEIFAGAAPRDPLELVVGLSTIQGTVLDVEGRPASALVLVQQVKKRGFIDDGGPGSTVATDPEGKFRARVVPGQWRLIAHGEGATAESEPAVVDLLAPGTTGSAVLQLKSK
jgi:hypothetical protein